MNSRRLQRSNDICLRASKTGPHPTANDVSQSAGSVIDSQYAGRTTEYRVVRPVAEMTASSRRVRLLKYRDRPAPTLRTLVDHADWP